MALLLVFLVFILASLIPCLLFFGRSLLALFLAPLLTAVSAALSAQLEVVFTGSFLAWFIGVVVAVNIVSILLNWKKRKDSSSLLSTRWMLVVIAVVFLEMVLPVIELRYPLNTVDGFATYYLHALFLASGHSHIVASLQNPALFFMNQNYPLLDPASQVTAFVITGSRNARLGMLVIAWLDICALIVVVVGLIQFVPGWFSRKVKLLTVVILGLNAVVGLALDASYVFSGDADLLWSACAVAAVIFGTLLPRNRVHFGIATLMIVLISVTKNEGFITAIFLACVLIWRYRNDLKVIRSRAGIVQRLFVFGSLTLVLTSPGWWWELYVIKNHLSQAFFNGFTHTEPPIQRIWPALISIGHFLSVGILALGLWVLMPGKGKRQRRTLDIASSSYLWWTILWYLGALMGTYVFGVLEIHYWLLSSTNRTTIFPVQLFFVELSIWFIVAISVAFGKKAERGSSLHSEVQLGQQK